ncbi:MAG: peptide chain release factor N(5)-glutamine methyltransferase, partial [Selenomonadaceae bacterium]|nr:peptide chain release factor N(5)-glutamine methyltransferase [Selenomonadaceae bacterium]
STDKLCNEIENARLEAEILLCNVLKTNRLNLYLNSDRHLTDDHLFMYKKLIQRRLKGEPIAYIVGSKEFMNFDLTVDENVLIPRPETEILVEAVIDRLKNFSGKIKIADLGTGSGAIAISIAKFIVNVEVEAVDISEKAIDIAKLNAINNNVADKINFHVGDLFDPIVDQKFNAIVSNPPYIPSDIINTLQSEVKNYEPRIALDGGADGLNFYRKIIDLSPKLLLKNGFIAVEIGYDQSELITNLIESGGRFKQIEVIKDLAGLDRIVIAKNK